MEKFTVYIEETLCRAVEVEAETAELAEEIVNRAYQNSEIILGADDWTGHWEIYVE